MKWRCTSVKSVPILYSTGIVPGSTWPGTQEILNTSIDRSISSLNKMLVKFNMKKILVKLIWQGGCVIRYIWYSASTTSTVPGMPGTQYGVANAVDTG